MKTILLTLTYLVGAGELILAIYFWVTNSKNEIRRVMALLAFSTGMWAITNALTAYVNPSRFVTFSLYLLFICGIISVTLLLYLIIIFPFRRIIFNKLHTILLFLPAVLIIIILLSSTTIIEGYSVTTETPGWVIGGSLFPHYQIIVGLTYITSLIINIYKIKVTEGPTKNNLKLFLFGAFFAAVPAIFLNIWASFISNQINPLLVVLPSAVWLGTTTYTVLKK